ncbi:MAG: rhodanese-like domain-containing protein, partial [Anaerolineales bacterium]
NGEAVLLDTRTTPQYQTQHAAGALSFPVSEAETRLSELDPDQWYITYCT